jgi:Domain of unknown function (DUF4349)
MRSFRPLLALLILAGCGREEPNERRSSQDLKTYEASEEAAPAMRFEPMSRDSNASAPAIGPTAAPGVAFNYRYAFRLQGNRVAAVQEEHAQACEKLGLARCRITGMRYRLVNEQDIEGMLAFKLDPAVARAFGKQGIEAVTQAEGMLIDSEITGIDAGSQIKRANITDAELNEDLRRIETQLARPGLRSDERARLQSELQQLQRTIRSNRANRDEQEESLATTPVVFQYGSGDLVPGFDAPVREAAEQAVDNFIAGFATLFVILMTLLPWAALLLLVLWLLRRLTPRWRSVGLAPTAAPAEA